MDGRFCIAVCDDNKHDFNDLKEKICRQMETLKFVCSIDYYSSGEELLQKYKFEKKYRLIIMDIYMDGLDGIQILQKIRQIDGDVFVAVVSTSGEYALQAIELETVHYLVKPVEESKLKELFERLFRKMQKPEQSLELDTGSGVRRFPVRKIEKVSSQNKGVKIQMDGWSNGVWIRSTFATVEALLSNYDYFLLISRGCLVNMEMILRIDFDVCRMKNGEELIISRRKRASIKQRYADYLFQKLERRLQ